MRSAASFAGGEPLHHENYAHVDEVKGDAYGKLEAAPEKAAA